MNTESKTPLIDRLERLGALKCCKMGWDWAEVTESQLAALVEAEVAKYRTALAELVELKALKHRIEIKTIWDLAAAEEDYNKRKEPAWAAARAALAGAISNCAHKNTTFDPLGWPTGEDLEVCSDCGMSRTHWEQGESSWVRVLDIAAERAAIQAALDGLANTANKEAPAKKELCENCDCQLLGPCTQEAPDEPRTTF